MAKNKNVIKHVGFTRISKYDFLTGVHERLKNDVEPYFDLIEKINRETGRAIGFWALVRMIFPIIEAVGSVIHKGVSDKGGIKISINKHLKLMDELKVPCSGLVWEIYRHSLMHGDRPRKAVYRKQKVNWELRIGGGHQVKHNCLAIDVQKCYVDFLSFLDIEIKRAGKKKIWIEDEILFTNKISKRLKSEFKLLSKAL
jgi:hypothetical protein